MPLFSEHISNMYYSGSPSYTSPSYGYKSSFSPLGTSYSASYLSPGGSYSKHSSLSSYSRPPLSSRWIPGISRSYSPLLTPISERGTASPIRINSPRRIPISKRCYGAPSYIQRPININTESIDVSRDRYRSKPAEPSASAPFTPQQRDESVKDNKNSPFMPRVDGKPETGIDSSPGMQRSTIKRGRTVVRLHTIKRKEKDSPRKPAQSSQLQDSEVNKQDVPETSVEDIADDPSESLSWREKLSEDLVYVDKKEKKSLGTKLVEKFLVRDLTEKGSQIEKSDMRSSEGSFQTIPGTLLPSCEVPSTSKSPDRRCSMELLAEQASLLDSLIRGENLSTATLDLSKVGITDEAKNKFISSVSIKRIKTDDKGNPLKTTKSDHSLHDNLNKSLKGNKDSKILSKKPSLKKSHSGGSICRLDSITEFPKEPVLNDLPAIQENSMLIKEQKAEQKPKLKTKITASVEITPPISPLKFRIENVVVEEKHHSPKKEVSFSYNMDEPPIQDVTLQGPKTTLRRTKERNSIKKKSKKEIGTAPISPEPEDGNFWAKIGKRETVYLMKRKQNIEAAKEENKKSFLWFPESEEAHDVFNDAVSNISIEETNDSIKEEASSDLLFKPEANILPKVTEGNVDKTEDGQLETISCMQLEKSTTSDNMPKNYSDTNNLLLKEKATKPIVKPKNDVPAISNKTSLGKLFRQDAEIKEDVPCYEENDDIKNTTDSIILNGIKTKINEISTNIETSNTVILEISQTIPSSPVKETVGFDKTIAFNIDSTSHLDTDVKLKSKEINVINGSNSKVELNVAEAETNRTINIGAKNEGNNLDKDTKLISEKNEGMKSIPALRTRAKSEGKSLEKTSKSLSNDTETIKVDPSVNLCPEAQSKIGKAPKIKAPVFKTRAKSEGKSLEKDSKPISNITTFQTAKASVEGNLFHKTPPVDGAPVSKVPASKTPAKSLEKDSMIIIKDSAENSNIGVNLKAETSDENKINTEVVASSHRQTKGEDKNVDMTKKSGPIESESNVNIDTHDTAKKETKSVNTTSPLETQAENKVQSLDKYSNHTSDEIKSDKTNVDVLSVESKTIGTLHTQAKSKPEPLVNHKQREPVLSNIRKSESIKNNMTTEKVETISKKESNKAEIKAPEKNTEMKTENISSTSTDTICKTCKKTVEPNSSKNSKLIVSSTNDPSTSKPSQGNNNIIKINARADNNAPNNVQEEQSVLDISVANSSNPNLNTTSNTSSSHLPVIEIKDIPIEKVVSYTEQVPTSVPSQEATGEENKADTNEDLSKFKQPSIKEAHLSPAKPIKEEKASKPLIATPRPLKKRAPQVIHSDSSGSSSEDDTSEEDSDTSEECGEFYECENNPDGRTSTGSNDSGFDSSAPTSPASFLQIKKDCDVNCHRKCEKLTANLCGVNQRLLVEALATRTASKKGADSSGPSSSNASSQLPATNVVDSELELEQSTAYGIFRKTGRFTPPARSIPRFRKYNIEDFQFIKVLGKGSFGKVLLAELRDTEYYYAVKCLKKDVVLEDDDVECTLIERKVLALGTNHPYLCHLFATFQTDSHLFFVMEYLNGGDLMFHIQQSGRFPEARARFYAAEIVSGLKFLHKRGIVYRDLKLDNILLDFDGHVRIADFGMCKLQIYLDKTADTFCGTPDYMAPEIIKGLKYNQTVDWWSFGVLLYEMLIGQSPFSGCDEDELFWSICNEMPSYPRFLSREALTILTRLLDKDARTRLGGTECMHGDVREQEFFHPVHWDKLERRELETPFKPRVRHPLDTQYFDRAFTGERPRLTAVEPQVLRSMDQEPFRGFSYTNPNATDR